MLDFIQVADLGQNRDKYLAKVTRTCGKGNWFWVFAVQKKLYSWEWGMQLYEDAFYEYFHKHPDLLKKLVENYHDIFVFNRFDCDSGLDYKKQNQNQDHYNDIAIRRCLTRFGISFKGKDLLELGKSDYCHSKVPFHLPHLMKQAGSVKSWFNSSRLIAVAPEIEDKAKLSELLVR
jgi:hypothetical protein